MQEEEAFPPPPLPPVFPRFVRLIQSRRACFRDYISPARLTEKGQLAVLQLQITNSSLVMTFFFCSHLFNVTYYVIEEGINLQSYNHVKIQNI